ncbi:oligopeptide transporter 7 [Schizosaccharomyces osmophilus]|uniref:Oligopeptide transporter 7 n=1 Tax=Schizosaccharomyces osmophilus TaxID=2545709 RepID=A0AAE9WAM9_9SCHI|nr:oligopeptide transporter 7 [Schizosaccharomyces osmophilus]WBW72749.1 oligopeptide transporter 7 [Schizosaccharomyces osmophilus]
MYKAGSKLEVANTSFSLDSELDDASKKNDEKKLYSSLTDVKEEDVWENEEKEQELEDDLKELPIEVRETVSLEDDPKEPTLTFRYFLMTLIFIPPGAFLDTMSSYRTSSAAYSVFFVQIASYWLGKWLAKILPSKTIRIWKFSFSLNPGPFSVKECVLVTLSAASGATGSQGTTSISVAELFYNQKVNPAVAIFFMWAIVWTGYSFAAIARNFLLYDPQYQWPQALMQTSLFEAFRKSDNNSKLASKQMRVFFIGLVGLTVWQFFPEYIFPMTGSLAFLCWVAPRNQVANFLGSGMSGMGFLNITLDWSNITSSIMIMPYWTQVIKFIAFVVGAWILLPAAKWGNLGSFKHGLMSNSLFLKNGTVYPATRLMTANFQFNETAYQEIGPGYMGTQKIWNMFFDYASYISAITWILFFGHKQIISTGKKLFRRIRSGGNISNEYTDRLNKIQSSYDDVPLWWFLVLFLISFVILITIFATGNMFIPWWAYIVALGFGAIIVTPMSWLYALSNFQLAIGTFNELIYGYMIHAVSGFKHPAGASSYGAIAGDAWYRAQYMLQDQKIGHYMHIPPRAVFFSQIFGELLGVPVNYGCLRWVLNTKREFLSGEKKDPLHQWTGQSLVSYNTMAIQYVLIGPKRLFAEAMYRPLPYGFLAGALAPAIIYILFRLFPKGKFHLWNITIFCSTMSHFYGNLSTGYFSSFIGGTITNFYFYRYRHNLWRKYNYILGAAFDTAFNLAMLLIFIFFSAGKQVAMPSWWGNNSDSVERCFAT